MCNFRRKTAGRVWFIEMYTQLLRWWLSLSFYISIGSASTYFRWSGHYMYSFVKCLFRDMNIPTVTESCSYLTDTEQKKSWQFFIEIRRWNLCLNYLYVCWKTDKWSRDVNSDRCFRLWSIFGPSYALSIKTPRQAPGYKIYKHNSELHLTYDLWSFLASLVLTFVD